MPFGISGFDQHPANWQCGRKMLTQNSGIVSNNRFFVFRHLKSQFQYFIGRVEPGRENYLSVGIADLLLQLEGSKPLLFAAARYFDVVAKLIERNRIQRR